jgi:hypothetical protein
MIFLSKCRTQGIRYLLVVTVSLALPAICLAQSEGNQEGLAKQVSNPLASLISVPILLGYTQDIGPDDAGDRLTLTFQPVIPFSINDDWNLITRTIVAAVDQSDIFPGAGSQFGISDTLVSLWASPSAPTSSGWIWGLGAAISLPTGSNDLLTSDKWGLGPTGVALKQSGPFTYGLLANHIWSVAGEDNRADVSNTFLQPFFVYKTPKGVSFTTFGEINNDWENDQSSSNLVTGVTKVTRVGNQMISWGGFLRYFADDVISGPEGLGFELRVTLLYPK